MIRLYVVRPVAGLIALSWSTMRFLRLLVLMQRSEREPELEGIEQLKLPYRAASFID